MISFIGRDFGQIRSRGAAWETLGRQVQFIQYVYRWTVDKIKNLLNNILRILAVFSRMIFPFLAIAAWELVYHFGLISGRAATSPSQIATTLFNLTVYGNLLEQLAVSLWRTSLGLVIGTLIGAGFAVLNGLSRRADITFDSTLQMLRALPHLALVPLFIMWLGIGEATKIGLVAFGCIFPVYLNLHAGIRAIDPKLIEVARSFRFSEWKIIRHVILPGALPSFLVGLRYGLSLSWLSLVVGEQVNARSGLGFLAMNARDLMRTDIVIACLVIYALLGFLTDLGVRFLERKLLIWRVVGRT